MVTNWLVTVVVDWYEEGIGSGEDFKRGWRKEEGVIRLGVRRGCGRVGLLEFRRVEGRGGELDGERDE